MPVEVSQRKIGPDEARQLLEANTINRKLNHNRVDQYAREMRAGKWVFHGDAIRVREDGALLDGQHRLQAIIDSDTTQEFILVEGLPDEAMMVVDRGRSRSVADYLRIQGVSNNPGHLAGVLVEIYRWQNGYQVAPQGGGTRPTLQEAMEILEAFPQAVDETDNVRKLRHRLAMSFPISVWTAFKMITDTIDRKDSIWFHHHFASGEALEQGSPLNALRRVILHWHNQQARTRDPRPYRAVMIKAWNAYRMGQTVQSLSFRVREGFPRVEGGDEVYWIIEP